MEFLKVSLSAAVKVCFPSISIKCVDTCFNFWSSFTFFLPLSPPPSSQSLSWRLSRGADAVRSNVTVRQCPRSPPCRCRRCYRRRIINALSQSHASFMRLLSLSLSSFLSLSSLVLQRSDILLIRPLRFTASRRHAVEVMQFFSSSFWALTIIIPTAS